MIQKKIGQQGRWPRTLLLFFFPFILFFLIRHFILEPFVIPSESMLPQLKIHDHILVNKYHYGLRSFFSDTWLIRWNQPQRGDIIVFRYPENRNIFFIKRLIGLPGDRIEVRGMSLKINNQLYALEPDAQFENIFIENNGSKKYSVMVSGIDVVDQSLSDNKKENLTSDEEGWKTFTVSEKSYFVMGDNRFNSHDSRFWGAVPENLLIGKAFTIWMSCEEMLESAPSVCDPSTMRWDQFFKTLH